MGFLDSVLSIGGAIAAPFTGGLSLIPSAIKTGLDFFSKDDTKNILGTIGSSALDLGGKMLQNQLIGKPNAESAYQNSLASSAYAFQKSQEAYKERYQNTMEDMRLAGLNPILAAGSGGFSVGKSPEMSPAQSFMPGMPNIDLTSSALNMAQRGKTEEEKKKIGVEIEKTRQETIETISRIFKNRSETKKIDTEERVAFQTLLNKEQEFYKIGKEIDYIKSQTFKTESDIARIERESEKLRLIAKEIMLGIPQLEKNSAVYKGPLGGLIAYINAVMNALNIGLGVVGTLPFSKKK